MPNMPLTRAQLGHAGALYPPASDDAIARAEAVLGTQLPAEYASFLRISNGIEIHSTTAAPSLFGVPDIVEMNEAYEVRQYLPHYLMIGSDGGGRAILLDLSSAPAEVVLWETGAFTLSAARRSLAVSLEAWVESGFDLGDSEA